MHAKLDNKQYTGLTKRQEDGSSNKSQGPSTHLQLIVLLSTVMYGPQR